MWMFCWRAAHLIMEKLQLFGQKQTKRRIHMGVYAITGGSSGIGAKTVELLKQKGHEVINIDLRKCDIEANLATPEGRQKAVDELHQKHPEGLDGMVCCAGVSGACGNLELIISLNFFGTIALVKGVYDLLKKKGGTCVVTSSNTISQGAARMDIADLLNNNNDDEQRILQCSFPVGCHEFKCGQQHLCGDKICTGPVDAQAFGNLCGKRCAD